MSESFQVAVWRILSRTNPVMGLEKVKRSLESVAERLNFVQCLYTRFLLLPKSVNITIATKNSILPEWENVSRHRALYFINQTKTCIVIAEPPKYIAVTDVIAAVISHILDSLIPLPIGSLFLCPESTEPALLDVLKFCHRTSDSEFIRGIDALLGKDILPQDAFRVQLHPLRPFYKGEIVAWRPSNGEKLKYGRVPENVRPSAGQALYRFMLETSPGITEPLLSSNVFSFKNISCSSEESLDTKLEVDIMVHQNTTPETSGGVMLRNYQVLLL